MSYTLQQFIHQLEQAGELIRVQTPVNADLEIAEITDRISKTPSQNKALLFEQTGTDFPVLINALGSERRMCLALGVTNFDALSARIEGIFASITKSRMSLREKLALLPTLSSFARCMPRRRKGRGACQQIIWEDINLFRLPVLQCWPKDGGKFFTLPLVHTVCPHDQTPNVGMYRMQVLDEKTTAMHWHLHKGSAQHFRAYRKLGKRMPVAVALGGDPVNTYAATAPVPDKVDEYILAGFLRNRPMKLVRCVSQPDIFVPEDADIVLEGYVEPNEDFVLEGPFGDHTGFYSLPDFYPVFHITAITQKRDAIFPATIVGVPPQEDAWIGRATERIFLTPMRLASIPELVDMHMPVEGVFHNLVLAKIHNDYPGHAYKVMNAMWGAGQMMFNKILLVFSADAPLEDYLHLAREALAAFDPQTDMMISQGPTDVLDHSCSQLGIGGKICLDFTHKPQRPRPTLPYTLPNSEAIHTLCKDITRVDARLFAQDIPVLFLFIQKQKREQIRNYAAALCTSAALGGAKIVIFMDECAYFESLPMLTWVICNHIDPSRDVFTQRSPQQAVVCVDATIKTATLDGFPRDWPNPVRSDRQTIEKVDQKWQKLGLGAFIPSPSAALERLSRGEDAQAREP